MAIVATIKQTGADMIQYTPVGAVTAGDIVAAGNIIGVASQDIAAGALGALVVVGVVNAVKPNDEAWTIGLKAYYDSADGSITTTATSNTFIGLTLVAAETAVLGDVILMGAMLSDSTAQEGTAVVDLTDSSGGVDPEDDTVAAITNIDALTDSSGGSADDTVSPVVAVADTSMVAINGSGMTTAQEAEYDVMVGEVNTAIGIVNDNFSELTEQAITQEAANTAILAAIAQVIAKQSEIIASLEGANLIAT